jgi:malonate-semialdehyde dehydrogenase (acetylating)/methylmalonate-semialdehyde dehydrogenase
MDASEELIRLIMAENGKNYAEAAGDLAKGLETVEWACSIPHTHPGRVLQVSSGVTCHEARDPVGVVASVVPFNFPFMVPMWTVPIALVCGNAVVLKPSEKVPLTMSRAAQLMAQAGVPDGVLQLIQGTQEAVEALCDHPRIGALTFVGSSRVAELVYERAKRTGKKALALGGAKNHLVAAPDCDVDMAATDIVASFAGCAGQRCMAASVLLTIGAQPKLVDAVVAKATQLRPGQAKGCMGPVIDAAAVERIVRIVDDAERSGAKVLLDGRKWREEAPSGGHWVGPTVLEMPRRLRDHAAMRTEIFGPVLCVHPVEDAEEALEIENGDPHGNAAAIYTSSGATADWFTRRFGAAMVGVNIGVPVPREPFSFGGMEGSLSKFGEHDITGDGGVNFFTRLRKVTTKWTTTPNAAPDAANFGGVM